MARPTLDQVRSVGDFAQVYRWDLVFASFPLIGGAGLPLSEKLNIRCESADLPKQTNTPTQVRIRGNRVQQAGISDFSDSITLTFVETTDNTIHLMLKAWRELIWAPRTGISQKKSDYEATILLIRLNNQDEPIWQYKLEGCWLSDYDVGQLQAEGDVMKPTMTLTYDFFTDSPLIG